jgi:hypothetical protein
MALIPLLALWELPMVEAAVVMQTHNELPEMVDQVVVLVRLIPAAQQLAEVLLLPVKEMLAEMHRPSFHL